MPALIRLSLLALLLPMTAPAAEWAHCPDVLTNPLLTPTSDNAPLSISADEVQRLKHNNYLFIGDVQLRDEAQSLFTDVARYNEDSGELTTQGNIFYRQGALEFQGSSARINLERSVGRIDQVDFRLTDRHSRGSAQWVDLQGPKQTILRRVSYTTCSPGNNDWLLRASSVQLDQGSGVGSAYNVRLSFKRVPFFYLPYISFPINDARKSGFLLPSFSQGSVSGRELSLPYYINLAANVDATLTPRFMSRRGNLLNAELRYLRPSNQGQLTLEYMARDRLYNNEQRGMLNYQHQGWTSSSLRSDIDLNMVSDTEYFSQLSNNLSFSSITHLRQQARLRYNGRNWKGSAIIEGYQTIDDSIADRNRPYRRLPQLTLSRSTVQQPNRLNLLFSSDFTRFSRNDRPSGQRLDLRPGLSFPLSSPGAYFKPSLYWYETHYQQNDGSNFRRGLPVLSIDSGLILERPTRRQQIQTLEPRLYYVHVPYRQQSQLPVFDSGLPNFTSYRLFSDNRFTGIDRIGDTQQLTLALTTRLIDPDNGKEWFSASIGNIFYNQPRRVTLAGDSTDSTRRSAILATTQAHINDRLRLNVDLRWNHQQQQLDSGNVQLRYRGPQRQTLNLSYRFNDTPQEQPLAQSDLSLLWPLFRQWHVIGRWNYSRLDDQLLESLAGIEYQSCCWALRLATRRHLSDTAGEYQKTIFLQLELKGLTSLGRPIEKMLENGILGYKK